DRVQLRGRLAEWIRRRFEVHAHFAGQLPDRVHEAFSQVALDEGDGVASRLASEALEAAQLRSHMERGGFLLVKRTPRLVAAPGFLELDVAGDNGDDVGPLQDLFNLALRNQQEPSPKTVPVRRRAGLGNPVALRVGIQVGLDSWALTSSEIALPSAFPCTLGISAFITAPMSLGPWRRRR